MTQFDPQSLSYSRVDEIVRQAEAERARYVRAWFAAAWRSLTTFGTRARPAQA